MRPSAFLFLLVPAFVATPAYADESAESLVAKGIEFRRAHRDAEALDVFRQANALTPSPRTLVQVALAEQAVSEWVGAEKDLIEALSSADPWVVERRDALRGALEEIQTHLGFLDVRTNVEGAELWVVGNRAGKLPAPPLRTVTGHVEIEIRAPGYESQRRTLIISPATTTQTFIDLSPIPPARPPSVATSPAQGHEGGSSFYAPLAWSALAVAGGSLAAAVVAHVVHDDNARHYNDNALCFYGALSRDGRCGRYRGRAEAAETVAIAGYVGAGVFGGAAAFLFVLSERYKKNQAPVALVLGPSGASMVWQGEF
ncbi:MAG TPA: hypothetical protein VJT73_21425 [Polyangiaceae bacterium]|nr:hypothetical protein [Polyangiaceae bacterium]